MMKTTLRLLVLLACCAFPSLAAEGRRPIYAPTTIMEPGVYVVTRDVANSGAPAIVVASGNVTLDLGGHTVSSSGSTAVSVTTTGSVTIVNGRVVAAGSWGHDGINASLGNGALTLRGLQIVSAGTAVFVRATRDLRIERCEISDSGAGIDVANPSGVNAAILDNTLARIANGGISLQNGGLVRVEGNGLMLGSTTSYAIFVSNALRATIARNTIFTGDSLAIRVIGDLAPVLVDGNVVAAPSGSGITVEGGSGHRFVGNTVRAATYGITAMGTGCVAEQNHVFGATSAIALGTAGVQRDNATTR